MRNTRCLLSGQEIDHAFKLKPLGSSFGRPAMRRAIVSAAFLHRFSRFTLVGVANTLVYAAATRLYVDVWGMTAAVAGGLGYATAVPMAFLGHRGLTFRAQGALWPQFGRFIATHLLGFMLAAAIPWLMCDLLGWPLWIGIGSTILMVPVASYVVMDRWVFTSS